jgi:hypothetical protein
MTANKKYELTPEHRSQLAPWADRWIANAMSTRPMDYGDREAMRVAVAGLYDAAGLPQPKHVVFVPSPLVLAFAGCFAAGIWHVSRHGLPGTTSAATAAATRDATYDATYDATHAATAAATRVATSAATDDATRVATAAATSAATYDATSAATADATYDATRVATADATSAATYDATRVATADATRVATAAATRVATSAATADATYDATRAATDAATAAATRVATAAANDYTRFLLRCTPGWYRMWNGGNQYSGWCAFLSFFRHVAHLELPQYERWQHYENAAIHGGPRIMHPDFCMISDRPEILTVDDDNRPHGETGPSHRWRDGWELWYWHGVRVTDQIVMRPDTITAAQVLAEENAEVRRVMVERMTPERFLRDADAKPVQQDDYGRLWRIDLPDDEPLVMVEVLNSTVEPDGSTKTYWIRVSPECETALHAVAWSFGQGSAEYVLAAQS